MLFFLKKQYQKGKEKQYKLHYRALWAIINEPDNIKKKKHKKAHWKKDSISSFNIPNNYENEQKQKKSNQGSYYDWSL
mgnify:CR=1 FL=1